MAPGGVQSFVFQLKTNNLPTPIWLRVYIIQMFLQCFLRTRAQGNSLQLLPCASTLHQDRFISAYKLQLFCILTCPGLISSCPAFHVRLDAEFRYDYYRPDMYILIGLFAVLKVNVLQSCPWDFFSGIGPSPKNPVLCCTS